MVKKVRQRLTRFNAVQERDGRTTSYDSIGHVMHSIGCNVQTLCKIFIQIS